MTLFQWIALPCVLLLAGRSALRLARPGQRKAAFWNTLVWGAAFVAILRPNLTTSLAVSLGIGRGADLVLYVFCVAFLLSAFLVYNRFQQMESHLTDIVRQLALREASDRWPENHQGTKPEAH
jgi:hypothetical protein